MTQMLDELDPSTVDETRDAAGDETGGGGGDVPPSPSRRWDQPPVLVALAAVLIGVAALATWFARSDTPGDDSATAGFARDMMIHHRQAVVMAESLRGRTDDPVLTALASDIATTQQGQIGQMYGWLEAWGLDTVEDGPAMAWMGHATEGRMPGMASPQELADLKNAQGQAAEEQFARLMIPHHQAGIDMAEAVLARTDQQEVRQFAQRLIEAQAFEIDALQDWLRSHGLPEVTVEPIEPADGVAGGHAGHGTIGNGGGMLSLAGPAASGALRLGPVALGAAALAWLLVDNTRRWRIWPATTDPNAPGLPGWRMVAAAGLTFSGVVHLALAPEQSQLSTGLEVAFWVAGTAAAGFGGAVLAWPRRTALSGAMLTAAALITAYFLFLLVAPPGADAPVNVEAVGLVTQLAQVAALIACVALWPPPAVATNPARATDATDPEDSAELTDAAEPADAPAAER